MITSEKPLKMVLVLNSLMLNSDVLPVFIFNHVFPSSEGILIMVDRLSFAVPLVFLAIYSVPLILISRTKQLN